MERLGADREAGCAQRGPDALDHPGVAGGVDTGGGRIQLGRDGAGQRVDPTGPAPPGLVARIARPADRRQVAHPLLGVGERGQLLGVRQLVGVTGAVQHHQAPGNAAVQRIADQAPQRSDARDRAHQEVGPHRRVEAQRALRPRRQLDPVAGREGEQGRGEAPTRDQLDAQLEVRVVGGGRQAEAAAAPTGDADLEVLTRVEVETVGAADPEDPQHRRELLHRQHLTRRARRHDRRVVGPGRTTRTGHRGGGPPGTALGDLGEELPQLRRGRSVGAVGRRRGDPRRGRPPQSELEGVQLVDAPHAKGPGVRVGRDHRRR